MQLPTFEFDGTTPEGVLAFTGLGDETFRIQNSSGLFLRGLLPYLTFKDNAFLGVVIELELAGVSPESPFFGGLPALGSAYVDELDLVLTEGLLSDFFVFRYVPECDFATSTGGFSESASCAGLNFFGPATAVSQATTVCLLLAGVAALMLVRLARDRLAGRLLD